MEIYLVYQFVAEIKYYPEARSLSVTDFVGCFDNQEAAIQACRTPNHFYYKTELNKDHGDAVYIIDVVYPKSEEVK